MFCLCQLYQWEWEEQCLETVLEVWEGAVRSRQEKNRASVIKEAHVCPSSTGEAGEQPSIACSFQLLAWSQQQV